MNQYHKALVALIGIGCQLIYLNTWRKYGNITNGKFCQLYTPNISAMNNFELSLAGE